MIGLCFIIFQLSRYGNIFIEFIRWITNFLYLTTNLRFFQETELVYLFLCTINVLIMCWKNSQIPNYRIRETLRWIRYLKVGFAGFFIIILEFPKVRVRQYFSFLRLTFFMYCNKYTMQATAPSAEKKSSSCQVSACFKLVNPLFFWSQWPHWEKKIVSIDFKWIFSAPFCFQIKVHIFW